MAGLCTNWLEVAFFPDPEPGPLGMGVGGWVSQYKSEPEEAKTHNYIHPWKTRGEGEAHFISLVLWEAKEKNKTKKPNIPKPKRMRASLSPFPWPFVKSLILARIRAKPKQNKRPNKMVV